MGRCKDGRCHHPSSLSYLRCVDAGNSPPPLLVEHNKSIREDASNLLTHGHGRHGGGMMMMMVLVASGSPTLQASPAVLTPADRSVTLKWSGMNSLPSYSLLILFLLWSYAFLSHLTSSLENRLTDPLSTHSMYHLPLSAPLLSSFCSRSQAGQDARYYL